VQLSLTAAATITAQRRLAQLHRGRVDQ
jgi:hypothetical protein